MYARPGSSSGVWRRMALAAERLLLLCWLTSPITASSSPLPTSTLLLLLTACSALSHYSPILHPHALPLFTRALLAGALLRHVSSSSTLGRLIRCTRSSLQAASPATSICSFLSATHHFRQLLYTHAAHCVVSVLVCPLRSFHTAACRLSLPVQSIYGSVAVRSWAGCQLSSGAD